MSEEVWIGAVEISPGEGNSVLGGATGAYTNVLVRASTLADYERQVIGALDEENFLVIGIEDAEPLRERMSRVIVSDEIVRLGEQAAETGLAWTSFYAYPTDDT